MPEPGVAVTVAVVAQLAVRRGRAAVEFYEAALGAVEVYRVGGTDEHESVVSQLTIDPAASVARAVAAGAREVMPVGDGHGWRLGRIEDPFGHHWEVGKPLVVWPPAGR